MLKVNPFRGEATNRTSVYIFEKNKIMEYPMNKYFQCENIDKKNELRCINLRKHYVNVC